MVSVEILRSQVVELKDRVNPDPKQVIIDFGFSGDNRPHGILYGSRMHFVITEHGKEQRWQEAIDTETELNAHKEYYDNLISKPTNKFMKSPDHPFHSFDSFIEYHRCKCGKHGPDNNLPYLGDDTR